MQFKNLAEAFERHFPKSIRVIGASEQKTTQEHIRDFPQRAAAYYLGETPPAKEKRLLIERRSVGRLSGRGIRELNELNRLIEAFKAASQKHNVDIQPHAYIWWNKEMPELQIQLSQMNVLEKPTLTSFLSWINPTWVQYPVSEEKARRIIQDIHEAIEAEPEKTTSNRRLFLRSGGNI